MMVDSVLFSSAASEWETPRWLFDLMDSIFYFDLDAAANEKNTKCWLYLSDAFNSEWIPAKSIWLNPPYNREVGKWVELAWNKSCEGRVVVCLLASRTDTKWWHEYVMKAKEIYFIKGRLRFSNSKNTSPFPSCVVVFDGRTHEPKVITIERNNFGD